MYAGGVAVGCVHQGRRRRGAAGRGEEEGGAKVEGTGQASSAGHIVTV
jgi:hypothetical protein